MTGRNFRRLDTSRQIGRYGSEGVRGGMTGPPVVLPEQPHQRAPQRDRAALRKEAEAAYETWLTRTSS
ncbi:MULTISPECIES: hypothetical protein [unclassified Bradyrhizobium]|uniref:hypothetical protein n=1 Tax=unclassified Bradyrhizobium TaxID=2631580 RepID=UPI0029162DBE|nr:MULTISPECIES: hypothetical protein [unclassified Bradyrhizobium]